MPRGKVGEFPISNRVSGRIGMHLKINTDIHDILRVLCWRYGNMPKAWLVEALIMDWVKRTSERLGTDIIAEWARDMGTKKPMIPLEDVDSGLDTLAGYTQPSVEEEALDEALEDTREDASDDWSA